MKFTDLNKDVCRLLLMHWSRKEIDERLSDPDYFFDQLVNPRLDYLRKENPTLPRIRKYKNQLGRLHVYLS